MIYYREDSKQVEFTPITKPVAEGEQGYIYKLNNTKCIKMYKDGMPTIDPKIFKLYQDLSLEGYSRLHELWYRDSKLQEVGAYIMDFYKSDADNILFMPVDYTIENLNILYNSVKILSEYRVLVRDLIPQNAILSSDKITVVDYDSSINSTRNIKVIENHNINCLMILFRKIYNEGFRKLAIKIDNNQGLQNYINHLFLNTDEPIKKLQKKMKKGRPIDYLYKGC